MSREVITAGGVLAEIHFGRCIVYRLSAIAYRLSAIAYRLSLIGYRLSAIAYASPDGQRQIHAEPGQALTYNLQRPTASYASISMRSVVSQPTHASVTDTP